MKVKLKPPDKRHPTCFGMPHRGFFRFFVAVNTYQNIYCVAMNIYDIVSTMTALPIQEIDSLEEWITVFSRVVTWVWFDCHLVVSTLMDIKLFRTATLPNTTFLRFYATFHCVSLSLMFTLYQLITIIGSSVLPVPRHLINMLLSCHVIYRIGCCIVVILYSRDIDFDKKMKSGYRNLTDEEINVFENGITATTTEEVMRQTNNNHIFDAAQFMAYNKAEFEINREHLDFSAATILGRGEYGCVYKIYWNNTGTEGNRMKIQVAMKTIDPQMADVNQFKALLSEAKVMMNMGRHENVVGLFGICTDEIRERKLYIVCELCEFGNLQAYLRSERNTFLNLYAGESERNGNHECINVEEAVMTTINLVKWSLEIATGMEFLAMKKIVHGDLAARNVLLTASKTAKITDFGLSRRLYNYSVYKKRHNVPLPWRWLALESMVDLSFSTRSDVWSYGVCCWEIFELGARPWPEFNTFTSEFIDALKEGRVQQKGELCSDQIYFIMISCWKRDPYHRPSFSDLKNHFSNILREITQA